MRFRVLAACAAISFVSIAAAQAQSTNDGTWAVTLITQSGGCDPSLRSSIRDSAGRVNEQSFFARISGGIDQAGKVALQVVKGADSIAARGTVKGQQASGSWNSPSRNCTGSWMATRI